MQVRFCGAAGQVTGSCHHFDAGGVEFLVDCGLFQGGRGTEALNRAPWPFDPRRIAFVVLTHAHIDHSGLLPKLRRDGFRGPVYATQATLDLIDVMLKDSAFLQAADAERARRHGATGPEAEPLYDADDVVGLLGQGEAVAYDERRTLAPGVELRLRDAGHILGSAIAELWLAARGRTVKVVCSGDLGEPGRPILRDPTPVDAADVLLVESTYGNRDHKPLGPTLDELAAAVTRCVVEKKGTVLVPAFAVGRTQELLYWFETLAGDGRLPPLELFVDSPLASEVTAITARHFDLFDEEMRRLVRRSRAEPGPRRLRIRHTRTVEESMALNRIDGGAVIVAASGMCDGGRIRHHLRHRLASPRTTVLFAGYQAAGTLGRRLVDRQPEVRIFGEEIPVRAEIVTLGGFSAHAGQSALLDWLRAFRAPPRRTFLVHGEPDAATAFAAKIAATLGWTARMPEHRESVDLLA